VRSVSVKELKDDVGRYLDEVLAGEEVVIKDRNKPVAKLIPFSANGEIAARGVKPAAKKKARKPLPPLEEDPLYITDEELEAHEARLVAEGKMRLPKIEPTPEFWEEFFKEPLADFGDVDLVRFISEDRDED
jgi:prevent-host-death family protein